MAPRPAGLVTFAGALFLVLAGFSVVDGIVAFAEPKHFFVAENQLLVIENYEAYGFVLLVIGGIDLLIGWGILLRLRAAQVFGIIVAILSALVHLAYFKHYPAWSVIALALNAVVIYALTVHNDEFAPRARRRR